MVGFNVKESYLDSVRYLFDAAGVLCLVVCEGQTLYWLAGIAFFGTPVFLGASADTLLDAVRRAAIVVLLLFFAAALFTFNFKVPPLGWVLGAWQAGMISIGISAIGCMD